jgi:hypothetical protein
MSRWRRWLSVTVGIIIGLAVNVCFGLSLSSAIGMGMIGSGISALYEVFVVRREY